MSNTDRSSNLLTQIKACRQHATFQRLHACSVQAMAESDMLSIRLGNLLGGCCAPVPSAPSGPSVPDSPTSISANPGNQQVIVSFTAPANDGGSTITGYTVTSTPDDIVVTGSSSPITITGLTNGISYTFTVVATNSVGSSAPSSTSSAVTPSADAILASLSTSLAAYTAAADDDWVKITSAEYALLQTNVSGTEVVGASTAYLTAASASGLTVLDKSAIVYNTATVPNTRAIAANAYLYAFAVKYGQNVPTPVTDARVFTNANSASNTGFNQVGSILPTFTNGGSGYATNYYVRKGVSSVNAGTAGILSLFTGATSESAKYLGFYINSSVTNSMRYLLYTPAATGGMPDSSTVVTGNISGYGAFAIQGLTATAKQWA